MKKLIHLHLLLAALALSLAPHTVDAQRASTREVARWEAQARSVTIIRDDWGIPHVYGKTDADAVFGIMYAQAEDDFNRVETNYLNSIGCLAEAEGESAIYTDLRQKLFIDPAEMERLYAASPDRLKKLMDAFADGLNFYLHKHPEVKPRVITRFEPWMALTFSEGSIGGDIERVNTRALQAFYGEGPAAAEPIQEEEWDLEPSGSNGIAIAPAITRDGHALLLINPHTSFFFRAEVQMVSEEGLNAYGAITWGQFFVYQGFNETAGWMHTSSGVDNIDEFLETVVERGGRYYYLHGGEEHPMRVRTITVPFKTDSGVGRKEFTVYYTGHGPIVRRAGEKWVSVSLMQDPMNALTQSYMRTRAEDLDGFIGWMELHTNSSNNTLFADAKGNIAYLHSNFIPRRDGALDWTRPVDGSDPATDWGPPLGIDESPNVVNPPNGWVFNTNDAPWTAAGPFSPRKKDFPAHVESGGENQRGIHATMVLQDRRDFTLESLLETAFDSYLPWFEGPIPALIRAWDRAPSSDPFKAKLAEQIAVLRRWDLRWSADSIPTALAVFWGTEFQRRAGREARGAGMAMEDYLTSDAAESVLLESLSAASDRLTADFGTWKTPWGEINRFQRLSGDIVQHFDDSKPSIPVNFTSAQWGSLASFAARAYPGTKKWYGTSGNSFVAVVEFGDRVRARAVTAGGESGHPESPHFNDEAVRYATGNLREVYFYREQLQGHIEREYHPGG
jgi:acyl-homoserine-lactone acylase